MRGIRTRLAITLVVLVALTGRGDRDRRTRSSRPSLRDRLLADARHQADFNLSVLLPAEVPPPTDALVRGQRAAGGLQAARRRRHDRGLRRREPVYARGPARRARSALAGPPGARRRGPARLCVADAAGPAGAGGGRPAGGVARPVLRVPRGRRGGGARTAPPGARGGRAAGRPRRADHRRIDRAGILRPVDAAARAARTIAGATSPHGCPKAGTTSSALGAEFNRMAATLETTVGRLETRSSRTGGSSRTSRTSSPTPLTALVGEASLIESGTAGMTPDARRARALVADIRRLRVLVDELMEISRFDADAEQPSSSRSTSGASCRQSWVAPPGRRDSCRGRGGGGVRSPASTGSWATSSTTPGTTRLTGRSRCP